MPVQHVVRAASGPQRPAIVYSSNLAQATAAEDGGVLRALASSAVDDPVCEARVDLYPDYEAIQVRRFVNIGTEAARACDPGKPGSPSICDNEEDSRPLQVRLGLL